MNIYICLVLSPSVRVTSQGFFRVFVGMSSAHDLLYQGPGICYTFSGLELIMLLLETVEGFCFCGQGCLVGCAYAHFGAAGACSFKFIHTVVSLNPDIYILLHESSSTYMHVSSNSCTRSSHRLEAIV